jgi:hypothetical protein
VRHQHLPASLRRDTDHAVAHRDLGSDAAGVTVVRDDEQEFEVVVGHEQHRGADPEQVVEQLERGLGELAESATVVEPADEHPQPVEGVGSGRGLPRPADRTLDQLAPIDPENHNRPQPEHTTHSGLVSDRIDLHAHRLEQLTARTERRRVASSSYSSMVWGSMTRTARHGLTSRLLVVLPKN